MPGADPSPTLEARVATRFGGFLLYRPKMLGVEAKTPVARSPDRKLVSRSRRARQADLILARSSPVSFACVSVKGRGQTRGGGWRRDESKGVMGAASAARAGWCVHGY